MLAVSLPHQTPIALVGALVCFVALRGDLSRFARLMIVVGWAVYALTSPTSQFPVSLRMFGVMVAMAGAIADRILVGRPPRADRTVPWPTRLVAVYLVFVFLGAVASPYGPVNLIRWVQGTGIVFVALYAVSIGIVERLLIGTFLANLVNVALSVRTGPVGVEGDPTAPIRLGGHMQSNHLAYAGAIVIIGAAWGWNRWPRLRLPLAAAALLGAYAVLGSESRTALLALVIAGLCVAISVMRHRGQTAGFIGALTALVIVVPLAMPTVVSRVNRDESASSLTTLTGRTDFWPLAVDLIERRPVVGWGIDVVTSPVGAPFQEVTAGAIQAHNAFLEAALMGGIPGAVAWSLALLGVIVGTLRRRYGDPYRGLLLASMVLLLVFAFTESNPAWFGDMFIVFALGIAIYGQDQPSDHASAHPRDDAAERRKELAARG